MQPMSAQDEQNEILETTQPKLAPKAEFQALVYGNGKPSSSEAPLDPIASTMRRHNLTREQAIEELDAWGF